MNIFLTGGAGGIGSAIVRALAADPAHRITFTFWNGGERAAALERECPAAKGLRCDLSRAEEIERVKGELAGVEFDAVINNAFPKVRFSDLQKTQWSEVENAVAVGVRAAFEFSRAFSAPMRRKKSGAIVTILSSSVLGRPPAKMAAYVLAKHALLGLHKVLAAELSRHGVRVNAVSPAMIRTEFLSELPDHYVALAEQAAVAKRLATPEEVAAVVKFLLSDGASYVNGANIPVTGAEAA